MSIAIANTKVSGCINSLEVCLEFDGGLVSASIYFFEEGNEEYYKELERDFTTEDLGFGDCQVFQEEDAEGSLEGNSWAWEEPVWIGDSAVLHYYSLEDISERILAKMGLRAKVATIV